MRIFNSTPRDDNFRMPGEFERWQYSKRCLQYAAV